MSARIAVIGCGHWGKNLVRTVNALGALAAVADPSAEARERAATLAPHVDQYDALAPVLADDSIDAVMIASPAEQHYEMASEALAAGKDVFVEKPMTIDVHEARDLVAQASAADRILMVGHLLEYHPAIVKLRELIAEGTLGKVQYVISNRLNLGKIRTEENALWSFAPHDIAVILRLVGAMPFEVVATGGSYVSPNIADVTVTQLLFNNGVRSHIFVSWLHPFKEQRLVVGAAHPGARGGHARRLPVRRAAAPGVPALPRLPRAAHAADDGRGQRSPCPAGPARRPALAGDERASRACPRRGGAGGTRGAAAGDNHPGGERATCPSLTARSAPRA
ncbi:MAG: Gfo/Idh/MocA family protein [Planctomycetota bacterium]|jgi:hypothetical protein